MDIRDYKRVKVINKSGGRMVSSAFSLAHGEERILENTARYPDTVLNDLNIFYERDQCDIIPLEEEVKKPTIENHTKTVTSETGREHVIYKPDKLINVEQIDTSGKAVNIGFSKIDAIELLAKHWKSLEKEVLATNDVPKLKLLLSVAKEQEITGKKYELIENRLGELI